MSQYCKSAQRTSKTHSLMYSRIMSCTCTITHIPTNSTNTVHKRVAQKRQVQIVDTSSKTDMKNGPNVNSSRKTEAKILIVKNQSFTLSMPDIWQTPDYVADCECKNSELFKQWAHNGHTAHTILHHNQSGLDKCHKQFPLQLAKGCEVRASLG